MSRGSSRAGRPALSLVPPLPAQPNAPVVSFCSHCGGAPSDEQTSGPAERVCVRCGLGLLLECSADVKPNPGQPFLVVDGTLSVCAVSGAAEQLLAVAETEAVNRHVAELLVPADIEANAAENLAAAVWQAARGESPRRRIFVRPANTFGVRLPARIAACGPAAAALVVIGD